MLGLLAKGHSIQEVAKWLEVNIQYVIKHAPKGSTKGYEQKAPLKTEVLEPVTKDPYSTMSDEDLTKTNLKEFRKYVQINIDGNLPNNSKRTDIIKAYKAGVKN